MSQTTVTQYGAAAFRGMLDGIGPKLISSFAAEAAIAISLPVKLGTNPATQVAVANTGASAIGFAVADHAREQAANGDVVYAAKETVSVLKAGRIWVETSDAVVAGAVANLTTATGKLTDAAVAAGIEAFTQINVKFVTSTTAAGLALVEVK